MRMRGARLFAVLFAIAAMDAQEWTLLGSGFHLTGDSAVDQHGNVYFTDNPRNRIVKIDADGKFSDWIQRTNGAHGVAFAPDGRLYAGQHDRKRIVAFASDGTESIIAEGVTSHHLTVTARNHVYFTEPPTHRVWLADSSGKRVVHEGLSWPRGVRAASGEPLLMVSDGQTPWVWSFRIQADGSLTEGRQFCRLNTDAKAEADAGEMTFDSDGLLYVATKLGLQVCDRQGRVVRVISTPGNEGVNDVFFAGPGLRWLYVVDRSSMYRRPASRPGVLPWTVSKRP